MSATPTVEELARTVEELRRGISAANTRAELLADFRRCAENDLNRLRLEVALLRKAVGIPAPDLEPKVKGDCEIVTEETAVSP